eukprot:4771949-Pyramimonas_sp.AAC.4
MGCRVSTIRLVFNRSSHITWRNRRPYFFTPSPESPYERLLAVLALARDRKQLNTFSSRAFNVITAGALRAASVKPRFPKIEQSLFDAQQRTVVSSMEMALECGLVLRYWRGLDWCCAPAQKRGWKADRPDLHTG